MRVILALILASGVYCRSVKILPQQIVLSKDLSDQTNEDYFALTRNHDYPDNTISPDILAQLQQYYLNKVQGEEEAQLPIALESEIERTAYLLINTIKQRNKRYTSYLTLCHFKICNMGRKRTARYFHMIKSLRDH